ncbi:hypothetical protein [Deinococcus petrolearius]|uniref:Antitoxin n=1 Tax=Deinococcus petrolearius TaxID=1751295 RepID=A0ABW1DLL4_9DEIO
MAKFEQVSATLPAELVAFLDGYQHAHHLDSRGAALAEAIRALQERELLADYAELGEAQASGAETYPADNLDGLGEA